MQIVAPGGVGKTQLVKKWRESLLDKEDHGGVGRASDWSFYSQGTQQQASADEFFDRALRWFGEEEPESYKDPWAKGERLAELVRQQPTLLILDGLEPLQHPPGPLEGELTDPSLKALLRGLQWGHPGLCIVTTREAVPDLDEMDAPKRVTIDLRNLSPAAGADLLRRYGVVGLDKELQQAARDYDGHSLALILLGTYLRDRFGGDIVQRNRVTWPPGMDEDSLPALSTDALSKAAPRFARHAHKVMASYVHWFEHEPDDDDLSEEDPLVARAAIAILRLMGLFNRPASAGCLNALRAEPPIPGLTEPLFAVDDRDELWQQAVLRLQAARLLADDSSPILHSAFCTQHFLDAHPLVREHFAAQLAENHPDAAREAHRRLYEHLKGAAPERPDNLNDMMPLYHAIAHGCKAGLCEDALSSVFYARIGREDEDFSVRILGAVGAGLAAISNFFTKRWSRPVAKVTTTRQSWILAQAGFYLRALGRLAETVDPMRIALERKVFEGDWRNAAVVASNLSELWLMVGDVSSAVRQAGQCVELADRSRDAFARLYGRTTLAAALQAAGTAGMAVNAFAEAEGMQEESQPQYSLLYSLPGYRYCDLLLDQVPELPPSLWPGCGAASRAQGTGDALEVLLQVRNRVETTLRWAGYEQSMTTLDFALDHLTLGRTWLMEVWIAQLEMRSEHGASASKHAEHHLTESVSLLRQAGTQHHLPRGLLQRTALWRTKLEITDDRSQIELAERDLTQAETIAEHGSMLIFQIEAALERTRLCLALDERNQAREQLTKARELIKQTEAPYEPHVPDWPDWEPPGYVGVLKKGEIVGYHCRNDEIDRLREQIDALPALS